MYFENTCKVNKDGKVSGFHKRGKIDDNGKITYFINDKYGDEKELEKLTNVEREPFNPFKTPILNPFNQLDSQVKTPKPLFGDNKKAPLFGEQPKQHTVNPFLSPPLPTYLNPQYFSVPKHRQIVNEDEWIKYCEGQTEEKKLHNDIKAAIREHINTQLDKLGFVEPDDLDDFKFAKTYANDITNPFNLTRWNELQTKYLNTKKSKKAAQDNSFNTQTNPLEVIESDDEQ